MSISVIYLLTGLAEKSYASTNDVAAQQQCTSGIRFTTLSESGGSNILKH